MNDTLKKFQQIPVPRYTSYPTAPHFHDGVDADVMRNWLETLPEDIPLSLYLHIPFCDTLCWFCGCTTKIVARYDPILQYVDLLTREIDLVADAIGPTKRQVTHIHWGGGSPTILKASDLTTLTNKLQDRFTLAPTAEIAVEIDPRELQKTQLDALATMGVTRASIGLQDVDPDVQKAINRIQPDDVTERCLDGLRMRGIDKINLDVMYGLPLQTVEKARKTAEKAVSYNPDRIALFGYAHVPWMKKHQRLIDDGALPNAEQRMASLEAATAVLKSAGYVEIGLDHFARPDEAMTQALEQGTLKRNFQGYTVDTAPALIGLGASAISSLPNGYAQNTSAIHDYRRCIEANHLPTAKGIALQPEDMARRDIINALMCQASADINQIAKAHHIALDCFDDDLQRLLPYETAGLVERRNYRLNLSQDGSKLRRLVCAAFDTYLHTGKGRHSVAV